MQYKHFYSVPFRDESFTLASIPLVFSCVVAISRFDNDEELSHTIDEILGNSVLRQEPPGPSMRTEIPVRRNHLN